VRGICGLRPGLPGVSERIRVISIVDRFLEHSRIWFFEAGGKRELWLGSADWMPRNFIRRVEVAFPIEDVPLKDRILDEILGTQLLDNTKARHLHPDGHYERILPGSYGTPVTLLRSQERLMTVARRTGAALEQLPVAGPEIFPSSERRPPRRRRKRL
jgi:polyphosphate kinase